MSRIRRHWFPSVLTTVTVTSLALAPMSAVASPVRRGAWYQASGHQPHYAPGAFSLVFRVTPDGRRITLAQVQMIDVKCVPASRSLGLATGYGSARIQHDGTFQAKLMNIGAGDAAGTTTIVTGRFLSNGRASGTLRYRGPGPYRGCNADGVWTAHASPTLPPVQHFQGKTAQGTRVTFDRTIESHPRLLRFNFGPLRATAGVPGCSPVSSTRSIAAGPPWEWFTLPVTHHQFSGTYMGVDEAYQVNVTGQFDAQSRASGTMSYEDRGDCMTGVVRWTAHRTG
jgi:hypothetical protein